MRCKFQESESQKAAVDRNNCNAEALWISFRGFSTVFPQAFGWKNECDSPKAPKGRTFCGFVSTGSRGRIFLVYRTVYHRLAEIETQYDLRSEKLDNYRQQQRQKIPGKIPSHQEISLDSREAENLFASDVTTRRKAGNKTLAYYLKGTTPIISNASTNVTGSNQNLSLEEARQGRERIISILEDAGIEEFDAEDVVKLPPWASIAELYYKSSSNINALAKNMKEHDSTVGGIDFRGATADHYDTESGPVILGLDGCARFRELVSPENRFLGVAGNFNSGTTAFGISLQKNCRFDEHPTKNDFVVRKRRNVFATNVNGMLSQVPWLKHKMAEHRHSNHTVLPPELASIDHNHVLPIVLVRDPFHWMQSMCKEGYGVRWSHDSNYHCPNLIPNNYDRSRFPNLANRNASSPIPVWMGASPAEGLTWPSLIHYWNAWYGSYYHNHDSIDGVADTREVEDSYWPRLMIRFEDTLFYPQQVMEKVCHCGGGKLRSEASDPKHKNNYNNQYGGSDPQPAAYEYTFEESKPHHKHEDKNNFVTAIIQYGTNITRLRNMTIDDIRFAIESVDPTLMKAFGYSYPNINTKP